MKALEEELGIELFDRGGRQLRLTTEGQSLYESIAPLVEEIDEIVSRAKKEGRRESVRVSVQPFFASEYFVPRLSEFSARYPDIDIYVGSGDESAERLPKDVDLSVRLFSAAPKGLPSRQLFPLRMAPAGSPDFRESIKLESKKIVSDFPLIVHETLPNAWQQWSAATGIELPKKPKIMRLESMIAVLRAAQRGVGAALVPVPMGELWFTEGSVVRLFERELVTEKAYYVAWKSSSEASDGISLLRDWILEQFAENT